MKTIVVEKNSIDRYQAYFEDKPGVWSSGFSAEEAVGQLVLLRPKELGVRISKKTSGSTK